MSKFVRRRIDTTMANFSFSEKPEQQALAPTASVEVQTAQRLRDMANFAFSEKLEQQAVAPTASVEVQSAQRLREDALKSLPFMTRVYEVLRDDFALMDVDNSGKVDPKEALRYTGRTHDGNTQFIADMLNSGLRIHIAKRVNDELGLETNITKADVAQLGRDLKDYVDYREKQKTAFPTEYNMAVWAMSNFKNMDRSGDGRLDRAELQQAIAASDNNADRQMLRTIDARYHDIRWPNGEPPRSTASMLFRKQTISEGDFIEYLNARYFDSIYQKEGFRANLSAVAQYNSRFGMTAYYDRQYRDKLAK